MTYIPQKSMSQRPSRAHMTFRFTAWIRRTIGLLIERHQMRAGLAGLDAGKLRDIGLTENDIIAIDHLPLSTGTAQGLSQVRKSRVANW